MSFIHYKRAIVVGILAVCLGASISLAIEEPLYETPSSSDAVYTLEYKEYVRNLRNKIEDMAYKRYDAKDSGTVSLDFEVDSNGNLLRYNMNAASTDASQKIIDFALDSLQKARPFEPFPPAMAKRYSKLALTIVLNFWMKKDE